MLTGLIAGDLITMAQKRTLSHFDTSIMVKIFGYRDVTHYYTGACVQLNPSAQAFPRYCQHATRVYDAACLCWAKSSHSGYSRS
jgi:hypothetical protein